MIDITTLKHALSKKSVPELKKLKEELDVIEPINLNVSKPKIIDNLTPVIPEEYYEAIVESVFHDPSIRYSAHLGYYDSEIPTEKVMNEFCEKYNDLHQWPINQEFIKPVEKHELKLIKYNQNDSIYEIHYSLYKKRLNYNPDARQSLPQIQRKIVRVLVNDNKKLITVFTGDKDIFNDILSSIMPIFNGSVRPYDIEKTGITDAIAGSFSYHTVKVIDFIYHGLTEVGEIGQIIGVELDTPTSSKQPQYVRVKGDDLLKDESICKYLLLRKRDIVGVKLQFKFVIGEDTFITHTEFGLKDNRIKIGIAKEKFKNSQVDTFFDILEDVTKKYINRFGLINSSGTMTILEKLRAIALK